MRADTVTLAQLEKIGRWRVEIFLADENGPDISKWPMAALAAFCDEIGDATDPLRCHEDSFTYIGLENVESITGDLVGDITKARGDIKSRCKVFRAGDVLYGRLRPNLRKVFAVSEMKGGLCSTEFIVLRPKRSAVSAEVLRALLASKWISSQIEKLQIGAALPRVSPKDLLAVKIPIINARDQRELEAKVRELKDVRLKAKTVLAQAIPDFEGAVTTAFNP